MDAVFKALADISRRKLLDVLHKNNGQTLDPVVPAPRHDAAGGHQASGRYWKRRISSPPCGTDAKNCITSIPSPLHEIYERWIGKYERHRLQALSDLKKGLEEKPRITPCKPQFVYVTYIRTTPEKLWQALIEPEFTRQFWVGTWQDCSWKQGASWRLMIPDGRVADSGEVLEIDPPRRLVLSWNNEFKPELRGDGPSRLSYEIEQQEEMVKLTVIHQSNTPGSKLIEAVSNGWPTCFGQPEKLAGNRRIARSDPQLARGARVRHTRTSHAIRTRKTRERLAALGRARLRPNRGFQHCLT